MKTYEPVDLGDCIVMSETEGGGWVKVEEAEMISALCRKLATMLECVPLVAAGNSPYADRAREALEEAKEVLKCE